MTCHGFGGGKVTSVKAPIADIKKIVFYIKQLKTPMLKEPVECAYAVKPHATAFCQYDIIFKFKQLGKEDTDFEGYNHDHLIDAIKGIRVNGHCVEHVDLWIIQ